MTANNCDNIYEINEKRVQNGMKPTNILFPT